MASIDQYKHRLLGFINCPSDYDIVDGNSTRDIAVYELLENVPKEEETFDGKTGDILVGGGSGEVPAFRITIHSAVDFLVFEKEVDFDNYNELFKSFWTPTESYKLCDGFKKLGWDVKKPIEFWLAENICKTLINEVSSFKTLNSGQRYDTQLKWRP